jgi:hypothetical protein
MKKGRCITQGGLRHYFSGYENYPNPNASLIVNQFEQQFPPTPPVSCIYPNSIFNSDNSLQNESSLLNEKNLTTFAQTTSRNGCIVIFEFNQVINVGKTVKIGILNDTPDSNLTQIRTSLINNFPFNVPVSVTLLPNSPLTEYTFTVNEEGTFMSFVIFGGSSTNDILIYYIEVC